MNQLTQATIGAAMEVHRHLGPWFIENVHEEALCIELNARGIRFERQKIVAIEYKGQCVGEGRLDLLVDGKLLVELKAVRELTPVDMARVLSSLKMIDRPLALLMNFNVPVLKNGLRRLIRTLKGDAFEPE